jgi:malonyl-CoA O-methyltransferase
MEGPEATFSLDRTALRAAFDRASAGYEASAALQARVGRELLSRLEPFGFQPRVVLDLGCGTGWLSGELKQRYRRAAVIALDLAPGMLREAGRHQRLLRKFERVCGDAMHLPLANSSVDLVFSSLMLQWCQPLEPALGEVRRILKPGGFFCFSTLGPDTLFELRTAWSAADEFSHVNRFTDMHEVGGALVHAGLGEPVLDVERVQLGYRDVITLMRELKSIGAHNVTHGRPRGLTGRSRLARLQAAYEPLRRDGTLPATYEVVYGVAWGTEGRPHAPDEVLISPSAIGRPARTRGGSPSK